MSAASAREPGPRARKAYEDLAAHIRDRILAGELTEGERLPSETALAETSRVSRSTVREALRTLEEAGMVERVSPRIMVVRGKGGEDAHREFRRAMRRQNVTFGHLHQALLVFEPQLSRLAAEAGDAESLACLTANLEQQEASLDDYQAWNDLDQEFHLVIAEMSGNPALVTARLPITELLMPALTAFMTAPGLTRAAVRFHHRILDEIRIGDADAAELMTRKHVNDFRHAWERAGLRYDEPITLLAREDVARAHASGG